MGAKSYVYICLILTAWKSILAFKPENVIYFAFFKYYIFVPSFKSNKIPKFGKVFVYHLHLELAEMLNQL